MHAGSNEPKTLSQRGTGSSEPEALSQRHKAGSNEPMAGSNESDNEGEGYYKVKYEDADQEELDAGEIEARRVNAHSGGVRLREHIAERIMVESAEIAPA